MTWGEWQGVDKVWKAARLTAKAEAAVVTAYVQVGEGGGDGMAYVAFDDVTVR